MLQPPTRQKKYTRADVKKHDKAQDMWIIIDDKVYDISNWGTTHPGGADILCTQAGRDATDVFYNFHHVDSYGLISNYFIGELEDGEKGRNTTNARLRKKEAIMRDYRNLTEECRKKGFFKSSKLYYAWKVFTHLVMLYIALVSLKGSEESWLSMFVSIFVTSIFYSQNGWLAHDFLHHQVFENRAYGDAVGMVIGCVFQGFSVAWWKNKHNTHHAASNELDHDPDIDQLPFLSFHPVLLRNGLSIARSATARLMIPIQVFTFVPLIALARVNWCIRSVMFLFTPASKYTSPNQTAEIILCIAHWLVKLYLVITHTYGWVWFLLTEAFGGCLIGLMFVLNHNGMHVFTREEFEDLDFVTIQVMTSRDIKSNYFTDFMSGGLNYQIEHHLFPAIPRHHFHKLAPLVDQFCKKHGIPVHRVSLFEGFREFFESLKESQDRVAKDNYRVPKLRLPHYD